MKPRLRNNEPRMIVGSKRELYNGSARYFSRVYRLDLKCASQPQQGFSMLELLIVVGMIAIIAAIAIPNLIASRRAGYEAAAKEKLSAIGQQQTAFKTLVGKRRFGTISELQSTSAGGSTLLTANDTTVTGWTFSDEGTPSATSFGVKVVPTTDNPATYSYYYSEDATLRRCERTGPWTKAACTAVQQ